jgi:hypothetical protein
MQPLCSTAFQLLHHYYGLLRPCASHWYSFPSEGNSFGFLPSHRSDRFPRSPQKPETGSRHLHTGHRPVRKQVAPGLVPSQQRCSVLMSVELLFDASSVVHLRSSSCFTPDVFNDAFSSTLTTRALYPSSSTWFGTRSCNPIPRGQTLISCRASPCGVRGTPLSQQFPFRLMLGIIP